MTRRILLTLGETTTETHCVDCPRFCDGDGDIDCEAFGMHLQRDIAYRPMRDLRCLAAEALAARMVEIDPGDLARCKWSVVGVEADESAERIVWALTGHAKKVSR